MDKPEYDRGNSDANDGTIPDADSTFGGAGSDPAGLVHTSRLAVVASILGAVSLLLVPTLVAASARKGEKMTKAPRAGGFTLIDLLIVIASCVFLLFISFSMLARTRSRAVRGGCGVNLCGIGRAMLIYANDYEDELPRAGGRNSTWGPVQDWQAPNRFQAYNVNPTTGAGGAASITSCFYLLVKYAEVTPKSFICKGDVGATEFKLADLPRRTVPRDFELIDAWDFGPPAESAKHCSYSYHLPLGPYALTTSSDPNLAVATERNPWMDSPFAQAQDFSKFKPDIASYGGTSGQARCGNVVQHQRDGQNVLFLDCHVSFEKRPYCGVDDDNIYTVSARPPEGDPWGTPPNLDSQPACRKDSLLVHDPPQLAERAGTGPLPDAKSHVRQK